jgi:hypothetical protein
MTARKPSYKELVAALGALHAEYCELDAMLDQFMANPSEPTADECKAHAANNRMASRYLAIYRRAVAS